LLEPDLGVELELELELEFELEIEGLILDYSKSILAINEA